MNQINFRVSSEEHELIKMMAKLSNTSISSLVKDISLREIREKAKILALELYKSHKVGLKQAWIISQLNFPEFLSFLSKENVEPDISESLDEEMINLAEDLSFEDLFPEKSKGDIKLLFTE